ncbi:MAG: transposase [Rhodospirillales bacterium]|jgi:transposase|nr:transposase [Geminicoccaceae bacterium]MDF2766390.1 transposase [Rhodospirillales bacterium]
MPMNVQTSPQVDDLRGEMMRTPDDVAAMVKLKELGWGAKRIAAELGCSKNTVKRWLGLGGWRPCAGPSRSRKLGGLEEWLSERFRRHGGNADVVRQELAAEKGLVVSLRTVERAVAPLRRELVAQARATVRFETRPGEQLQIDFGERRVEIGGASVRVFLFVATLGYSRRLFVRAFGHEKQDSWFEGMEGAFRVFGGVPEEVLLDNARALVLHHDPVSREVVLHPRLHAFAKHWGFRVRACAPYRARTKGKDERGVGYVKRNAIAGRSFATWPSLEAHLEAWTRDIADVRLHGTTGEAPIVRFRRDEAAVLKQIGGVPPFLSARDLLRRVGSDCTVEVDGNAYSVPWRLIGERVRVTVGSGAVRILYAGREVAVHAELAGRHGRAVEAAHFAGVTGAPGRPVRTGRPDLAAADAPPALLRPLAEYEALVGGGF